MSDESFPAVTDEEAKTIAQAVAKSEGWAIDWETTQHDKRVQRENLVARSREFLTMLRACLTWHVIMPPGQHVPGPDDHPISESIGFCGDEPMSQTPWEQEAKER